ncbi:MAG: hypothetical protein LBI53_03165 [Candidatus Peribacteria bacterium]|nr:hypothetical protein [Candidatus Peribacteria bacterium]
MDDLASIPTNFALYEPLDLVNFHDILSKRESKYLRIPHQHFPESIFSVEDLGVIDQQLLTTIEVLSLKSYGYAGDNATLLASAANFSTALQAGTILQEQSTPIDIFIISKLNADWNAEIISSLKTTKKLIVMIDHQASKSLQYLITTQLQKHVLNDIEVIYFTPEYEKLTTIFDEFAMEQTGFDAERLVSCFLSDCTSRSPAGRRGGGGIGPRYQSNITIP